MEVKVLTMLLLLLLFLLSLIFIFRGKKYSHRIPPGSLGLPLIGQSLDFLKALKDDKLEVWLHKGIAKHGPIWKAHLFGYPTVVLHGTAANKFIHSCHSRLLTSKQPPSVRRVLGSKNIFELTGDDHKRVRSALLSFLKPEVLKQWVSKLDEEIQNQVETHWHGKKEVKVQSLIRILTFNAICSLLFGIERGPKREKLLPALLEMMEGYLAIPFNLPFTHFNRGIKARKNMVMMLGDLLYEKKKALKEQKQQPNFCTDIIMSMLSIGDDDSSTMMSDEEIIDNIIIVMVAGYDTTSILLSCLVKLLANDKLIYSNIVQEHEEISKSKAQGEALTWEDLAKMKYTWRVASEMLRINPPINVGFRQAAQDIEYEGYIIPKGWQVTFSSSMTHMDDNIFQNPTIFDPARFEKNAPSPPPFSYMAFGAGPRMCPGMEFGRMETLVMIHRLVTQFTWELVNKDETFSRIPLPDFHHGLQARITPIKQTSLSNNA